MNPISGMQFMTDMLLAAGRAPNSELADAALISIVPHLDKLLEAAEMNITAHEAVKDPFKAYTLAVLSHCVPQRTCVDALTDVARHAFRSKPYWFMMALTDALEQGSHPAHAGALRFGEVALAGPSSDSALFLVRRCTPAFHVRLLGCLFGCAQYARASPQNQVGGQCEKCQLCAQEVLSVDRTAAEQVAMLLRSCITEASGNEGIRSALQLMSRMDALLQQPQRHGSGAGGDAGPHAAPAHAAGGYQRSPSVSPRGGSAGRDSREDESPGSAGGSPGRPDGGDAEMSSALLRSDYGSGKAEYGTEVESVGVVLRLAGMPSAVDAADVRTAVQRFDAKAIELLQQGECLVEFREIGAAVHCFSVLPAWLERLGFGRVRVTFACNERGTSGAPPSLLPSACCHDRLCYKVQCPHMLHALQFSRSLCRCGLGAARIDAGAAAGRVAGAAPRPRTQTSASGPGEQPHGPTGMCATVGRCRRGQRCSPGLATLAR